MDTYPTRDLNMAVLAFADDVVLTSESHNSLWTIQSVEGSGKKSGITDKWGENWVHSHGEKWQRVGIFNSKRLAGMNSKELINLNT